jgi:hypothetical protein
MSYSVSLYGVKGKHNELNRIWKVLTMVHNTQNYRPEFKITRKHNDSETSIQSLRLALSKDARN